MIASSDTARDFIWILETKNVLNDNGINIYQETFKTDELSLAMGFANLPKGEYFVSIKAGDGEVVKPFK